MLYRETKTRHSTRAPKRSDCGNVSAFLDAQDLQTLTGYKRPADQIRWLERNGVPFTVNRLNRPVVRRDLETQVAEPELGPVP